MKGILRWAVNNSPAMNTLMIGVLVVGAYCAYSLRRESFPVFELEILQVNVSYPGASPEEVEEGICQKIEAAISSIDGIKKMTSTAYEGMGEVILELNSGVRDVQKVLSEVRTQVSRIPSFPESAREPHVSQFVIRENAIRVVVVQTADSGPDSELKLRELTESLYSGLLNLPTVTQVRIFGARDYEINVEVPQDTLRRYNLTLEGIAANIRRHNLDVPVGTLRTDARQILVRGRNKRVTAEEIGEIPVVTEPGGVVLTVADLGNVRDEFVDSEFVHRINGKPGHVLYVEKTPNEDLLAIVDDVRAYLETKEMPAGYELMTYDDESEDVRSRLRLLTRNGIQGLILVFLVLALFLEMRLAFWVSLGIPISICGACAVLLVSGHTLNMLSMFSFVIALGIVVDDAIVIGENVHAHRERNKSPTQAAVDGAYEVLPSVTTSVATTIIAFVPLFFVTGVIGKYIGVLPLALVAILAVSWVEASLVLPCHLAHSDRGRIDRDRLLAGAVGLYRSLPLPLRWTVGPLLLAGSIVVDGIAFLLVVIAAVFHWCSSRTNHLTHRLIERVYLPVLGWSLRRPEFIICSVVALLLLAIGAIRAGITPFVFMSSSDTKGLYATVEYPDGTPVADINKAVEQIERALYEIEAESVPEGGQLMVLCRRAVFGNFGYVFAELVDSSQRDQTSAEIVARWRDRSGQFPEAERVAFEGTEMSPGGIPIEFELLSGGVDPDEFESVVDQCKAKLNEYAGVFDVADDWRPGKWEYQVRVKEKAHALGIALSDLSQTLRAVYYGAEVMRIQRGRHEVKIMVTYPREERHSLANFEAVRVRGPDGSEYPLTELADVTMRRGYSQINRVNQQRAITVTADVDQARGNARRVAQDLKANFLPALLADYPQISVRWEGEEQRTNESLQSMAVGVMVALVGMFGLLTMEFRSHVQPLLVLAIIPFGGIGAVCGHWVLGLPLTIFSFFGMVGLAGIVVNDSIVLIDFVNQRLRDGAPLRTALLNAGRRRFRPVVITSITTICGLTPILLDRSLQAQWLIPMATSICFGLAFSTVLVLLLMPVLFSVYYRVAFGENRLAQSSTADARPTDMGESTGGGIVRADISDAARDS